jgi:hypothetical protein
MSSIDLLALKVLPQLRLVFLVMLLLWLAAAAEVRLVEVELEGFIKFSVLDLTLELHIQ